MIHFRTIGQAIRSQLVSSRGPLNQRRQTSYPGVHGELELSLRTPIKAIVAGTGGSLQVVRLSQGAEMTWHDLN